MSRFDILQSYPMMTASGNWRPEGWETLLLRASFRLTASALSHLKVGVGQISRHALASGSNGRNRGLAPCG